MLAPRVKARVTIFVSASVGKPNRKPESKTGTWWESRRQLWALAVVRHGPGLSSIHLASWVRPGWAEEGGPSLERLTQSQMNWELGKRVVLWIKTWGLWSKIKRSQWLTPETPAIKWKHLLGLELIWQSQLWPLGSGGGGRSECCRNPQEMPPMQDSWEYKGHNCYPVFTVFCSVHAFQTSCLHSNGCRKIPEYSHRTQQLKTWKLVGFRPILLVVLVLWDKFCVLWHRRNSGILHLPLFLTFTNIGGGGTYSVVGHLSALNKSLSSIFILKEKCLIDMEYLPCSGIEHDGPRKEDIVQ